ncbi:MAG: choloylglycine hydrolase [Lachnospiraceae bacterium]|jgi:choloylglycine hydrolase
MCTAAVYHSSGDHYFGRNLDLERSYHETVTIAPRNLTFPMRHLPALSSHYAIIGMAFVVEKYPLFYDGMNEKGLCMAGLNFPGNACYRGPEEGRTNIASFELIPYVLGTCATVKEAREFFTRANITSDAFSPQLPPSPLHWMLADAEESIVVEQTSRGLAVYDNPAGVMTNNPTFDYQMTHLTDYLNVTAEKPENRLASQLELKPYCLGMGGIGLPGDLSSSSRFVKAAFTRLNSVSDGSRSADLSQFFKILGSVEQQKGCSRLGKDADGQLITEYTVYSSCCDMEEGIYYYTTYENSQITGVSMNHENLDGSEVISWELVHGQQIRMEN